MDIDTLQAESVCENTDSEVTPAQAFLKAHAAWRRAKAEWDMALYAPGMTDKDLPDEEDKLLCGNHAQALDCFLRTRSASWGSFVWKLRAFRDEEVFDCDNVGEIVSALLGDAERLLREDRHGN